MKKQPVIAGIVLLLVLGGVAGGLAWYRHHKDAAAAGQGGHMPVEVVDVVKAEEMSWQPTSRLVGTVIAKRSVMLANEVAGVVESVTFETGDEVSDGQVLLTMDTATEQAELATAEASERLSEAAIQVAQADIRVSQANLELAKSNQERFKNAGGSISAAEVDRVNAELQKSTADLERQRSSLARAQAELDQAKARANQVRIVIDKKTLKAPFHALASIRTVHPGQYLAEGASIVMLNELTDDIYLDFAVPQEYASRVAPGMVVVASSKVLGSKAVRITVLSMDSMVNPATRNIRVRSTVDDPQHRLKQGMFIDVEVPVDAPENVVTIPTTAVRRAAFGDHVFVIGPGDDKMAPGALAAHQRMVTLGADIGGKVVVISGLKPGEEVASGGSFKLRDGAPVQKAAPASGAAAPTGTPGGTPADTKAGTKE